MPAATFGNPKLFPKFVGNQSIYSQLKPDRKWRMAMADDSGSAGMLGILVGILIVVLIGGGLLFANGNFGKGTTSTVKIEVPKITTK